LKECLIEEKQLIAQKWIVGLVLGCFFGLGFGLVAG
jgi:hypothetical protein